MLRRLAIVLTAVVTLVNSGVLIRLKRFSSGLNRGIPKRLAMIETLCIDSPYSRGRAVPKAYSSDLRVRVIEAVAAGASRREAAERFEVSIASAVKWLQRWRDNNSAAPKPSGGSVSPLEEFAAEILAVVAEHPDLTLEETVAELRKQRIRTSRSALWRFLDRHNITLKKNPASCRTAASRCGARTPALDTRARLS
jgi:transposase